MEVNGIVRYRKWGVILLTREMLYIGTNTDEPYSRFNIFMLMVPPWALDLIFMATKIKLELKKKEQQTKRDIKVFWCYYFSYEVRIFKSSIIMVNNKPSKYDEAPSFGTTKEMIRSHFDLLQCIWFSYSASERFVDVSSETYSWKIFDGFVKRFNKRRVTTFFPSENICGDKSISRWCVRGDRPQAVLVEWM